MSKKEREQPLQCDVIGEKLVISIGIGTLAWAAKKKNGGPLKYREKVTDRVEFAKDVSRAICHEDEIGNSMLADMLDKAMRDAVDCGSVGVSHL